MKSTFFLGKVILPLSFLLLTACSTFQTHGKELQRKTLQSIDPALIGTPTTIEFIVPSSGNFGCTVTMSIRLGPIRQTNANLAIGVAYPIDGITIGEHNWALKGKIDCRPFGNLYTVDGQGTIEVLPYAQYELEWIDFGGDDAEIMLTIK